MNKELYYAVGRVFTPHTAVGIRELFSGRKQQLRSLARAISSYGGHAIIFGERGVGKTSLGNFVKYLLPEGVQFASFSCDANTTFNSIWDNILSALFVKIEKPVMGFPNQETSSDFKPLSDYIPDKNKITGQQVRIVLEYLKTGAAIVIDELDKLDKKTTTALADTIKMLSDYNVDVTLVLIGVGESVGALIKGHESIERALVQIHMPRMTDSEIEEVIEKGLNTIGMTIDDVLKNKVIILSRGLPHYTHLLMFHACQNAAEKDRKNVTEGDITYAIEQSIFEKEQSLKDSYNKATQSTKKAFMFIPTIFSCALADTNKDGFFALIDVQKVLKKIFGREVPQAAFISHIGAFCSEEKGPILEKIGAARKYRYHFRNPLMQSFVIMKSLKDGMETKTPLEDIVFEKHKNTI